MFEFITNFFKSSTTPETWTVDKSTIKGKYQDLKHAFLQNHGDTFQIHFNETGKGINVVLFLASCTSIELKHFLKYINAEGMILVNVICICDTSGFNLTLVLEKV